MAQQLRRCALRVFAKIDARCLKPEKQRCQTSMVRESAVSFRRASLPRRIGQLRRCFRRASSHSNPRPSYLVCGSTSSCHSTIPSSSFSKVIDLPLLNPILFPVAQNASSVFRSTSKRHHHHQTLSQIATLSLRLSSSLSDSKHNRRPSTHPTPSCAFKPSHRAKAHLLHSVCVPSRLRNKCSSK